MEPLSAQFCICSLLQVVLIYAKVEEGLRAIPYVLLFLPLFSYFLINVFSAISDLHSSSVLTTEQATRFLLHLFTQVSFLLAVYFYAEMLDYELQSYYPAAIPFVLAISANLACHIYVTAHHSSLWAAAINLITPALSTCSTSGLCTSLYASTLASFFSTFGISIIDLNKCLWPLTLLLLSVTLYSLYYTRRTVFHKPFILGLLSGVAIIVSQTFVESRMLTWGGNALLVAAVLWNNRLAKYDSGELSPHKLI